jgi:non-ribosomal peptide synthetase component E (peptide arylation enzyme)
VNHEPRPLFGVLEQAVEQHGGNVALRMGDDEWTYAQLGHLVDQVAIGLAAHGVTAGSSPISKPARSSRPAEPARFKAAAHR